jgi:hypothetical protein
MAQCTATLIILPLSGIFDQSMGKPAIRVLKSNMPIIVATSDTVISGMIVVRSAEEFLFKNVALLIECERVVFIGRDN